MSTPDNTENNAAGNAANKAVDNMAADKPDEIFDPHRFEAEPKRKKSKALMRMLAIFVAVMVVIGGSIAIVQARVSSYFAQRAEAKQKAKLEEDAAKADDNKQAAEVKKRLRSFKDDSDTKAALPAALGKGKDLPPLAMGLPKPMDLPPPPPVDIASTKPSGMMLDEDSNESPGGKVASPFPPLPTLGDVRHPGGDNRKSARPGTVQELANLKAQDSPLTKTEQVSAANLGNRSYLLARGSFIPCVLETQLISNIPGNASCVVPQTIYSDDGKVVLIEKGSQIVGQYKNDLKNGDSRIAILWERVKTTNGMVLDVDSPAADSVGTMGVSGYVDNHWMERIGAAFLLSLVQDAVSIEIAKKNAEFTSNNGTGNVANTTPTATISTGSSMADQVLRSTINIPPTLYKNRGDRVMVYVNRDLWFDSVYQLTQR
jgi:type IV secretion system protein VirB10